MKNNNLYNYSTPKSGNEETNFFNIKGRITMTALFGRLLFAVGIYSLSWVIFNQGIYTWFGVRIENFFETIHLYILPVILIAFVLIQGAKRVHDVNKSGWLFLIPFYNVYLSFCRGTIGSNNYGIDPKPMAQVTYFDEIEPKSNSEEVTISKLPSKFNKSYIPLILLFFVIFIAIWNSAMSNHKSIDDAVDDSKIIEADSTDIPIDSTISSGGFDDSELIGNSATDSSDSSINTKTVSFTNDSSKTAWLVYAFLNNNNNWETIGWFEIKPKNSESFILPDSFSGDSIYWYAEDSDEGRWEGKDGLFCVTQNDAFHFYTSQSNENCKEERSFHKLNLTGALTSQIFE